LSYTSQNFSRKIYQKFVFIYLYKIYFAFIVNKLLCLFQFNSIRPISLLWKLLTDAKTCGCRGGRSQ